MSPGGPPLTVVALGGNAISPPRGELSLSGERAGVDRAAAELGALARAVQYAAATRRPAVIAALGHLGAALEGRAGTRIDP